MPWKRRNRCEPCVALSCLAASAEKILSKQKQEESWNSLLRKNISRIPKHFPIIWEAERARARSGWMQDLSSWLKLHRKSLILPRRRSPAVQWQTYSWIQAFWVRTSIYTEMLLPNVNCLVVLAIMYVAGVVSWWYLASDDNLDVIIL